MIVDWLIRKLQVIKESKLILINDPLRLLPEKDAEIHRFARENHFLVIIASTNLVLRKYYEDFTREKSSIKLIVIDRVPLSRRGHTTKMKAPPLFYPDLLQKITPESRLDLDLAQILRQITGDPLWPEEANKPELARLIARNWQAIEIAHQNLGTLHPHRFSDNDFRIIITYAVLGIPGLAFKKADHEVYWKIALFSQETLHELKTISPELTKPVYHQLKHAPPPFCCFLEHPPEIVLEGFYLSLILSQHLPQWESLLYKIDPDLAVLPTMQEKDLEAAANKLILLNPQKAQAGMEAVENKLKREILQKLLLEMLDLQQPAKLKKFLEKENYSPLLGSLALLLALENLLSPGSSLTGHQQIPAILEEKNNSATSHFLYAHPTTAFQSIQRAYSLAYQILQLKEKLEKELRQLNVKPAEAMNFSMFFDLWNKKKLNRMEYLHSSLERMVDTGEFLPRPKDHLPSKFENILTNIREQVRHMGREINKSLAGLNRKFQALVYASYVQWIGEKNAAAPVFTAQFLERCLKPHWDHLREKAVIFIFDGMRYEIWNDFIKPLFESTMELIHEYPAAAIIPTRTEISRKSIAAGTFPAHFNTYAGEDTLLAQGLARRLNLNVPVTVVPPDTAGTGETVRYQAGNLDIFIFELCDKELHNIRIKTLLDQRRVPVRPLAQIYQKHIKDIIDNEVWGIVRELKPGTKVFVVADHGFTQTGSQRLQIEETWLNHPKDCHYRDAKLKTSLNNAQAPTKARENVWEFPVKNLELPEAETTLPGRNQAYETIIFPRGEYSLARPQAHFNPEAYSHGGISLQEMMVPMAVLRVKGKEEAMLIVEDIAVPGDIIDDKEIEFSSSIYYTKAIKGQADIQVTVSARYAHNPAIPALKEKSLFVSTTPVPVVFRFKPDIAAEPAKEERRKGMMTRDFIMTVTYTLKGKTFRQTKTRKFDVPLTSDKVIRPPTALGTILGLTPKKWQ